MEDVNYRMNPKGEERIEGVSLTERNEDSVGGEQADRFSSQMVLPIK